MFDPDNKIDADSTWESPPRRQWIFKVFASLALFGFLVGLMLGRLLEEPTTPQNSNTIVQLQTYVDGLGICLSEPAQVQAYAEQGVYQLLLLNSKGQSAHGEFALADGKPVRWRVEPQKAMTRIVFIALQPVIGQWSARLSDDLWCVDVQVSLAHTWVK